MFPYTIQNHTQSKPAKRVKVHVKTGNESIPTDDEILAWEYYRDLKMKLEEQQSMIAVGRQAIEENVNLQIRIQAQEDRTRSLESYITRLEEELKREKESHNNSFNPEEMDPPQGTRPKKGR